MKILFKTAFTAAIAAVVLSACASAGNPINRQKVQALHVGQTTITQARASLGKPNAEIASYGGTTMLEYIHVTVRPNGATFIPVVGLFAGKATSTSDVLLLTFDRKGILAHVQTQNGSITAGPGN